MRLASALRVLIEELVAPPRDSLQHYSADELPQRQRGSVLVESSCQMPCGVWISSGSRSPLARNSSDSHTAVPEYLCCERGQITLTVGGHDHVLEEGEVLVFRGDQQHTHECGRCGGCWRQRRHPRARPRLNSLAVGGWTG